MYVISDILSILYTTRPPKPGHNALFSISGILSETITSGEFHMNAKLFLFNVQRTGVIPPETLPAHIGSFTLTQQFFVPNAPIHGTAHITVKLTNQQGKQVTCLKFDIEL